MYCKNCGKRNPLANIIGMGIDKLWWCDNCKGFTPHEDLVEPKKKYMNLNIFDKL